MEKDSVKKYHELISEIFNTSLPITRDEMYKQHFIQKLKNQHLLVPGYIECYLSVVRNTDVIFYKYFYSGAWEIHFETEMSNFTPGKTSKFTGQEYSNIVATAFKIIEPLLKKHKRIRIIPDEGLYSNYKKIISYFITKFHPDYEIIESNHLALDKLNKKILEVKLKTKPRTIFGESIIEGIT